MTFGQRVLNIIMFSLLAGLALFLFAVAVGVVK